MGHGHVALEEVGVDVVDFAAVELDREGLILLGVAEHVGAVGLHLHVEHLELAEVLLLVVVEGHLLDFVLVLLLLLLLELEICSGTDLDVGAEEEDAHLVAVGADLGVVATGAAPRDEKEGTLTGP